MCQNVEDAQRAITLGRGMLINGRPCRTEVARVNRKILSSYDLRIAPTLTANREALSIYLKSTEAASLKLRRVILCLTTVPLNKSGMLPRPNARCSVCQRAFSFGSLSLTIVAMLKWYVTLAQCFDLAKKTRASVNPQPIVLSKSKGWKKRVHHQAVESITR